jgi:quaternary ammonium compound-resistance protein SugE
MSINWILLIVGGLFETCFAVSLGKAQQSSGKELWLWLLAFAISVSLSMLLLFKSMGGEKAIPVGTAYAVWTAIGAIGTVIAGIIIFKEPVNFWRVFFSVDTGYLGSWLADGKQPCCIVYGLLITR